MPNFPIVAKFEQEHDFVNVPVLLHAISSLSPDALGKTSDLVLSGLALCVDEPGSLRSEMMTSPDFWAILRALAGKPSLAAMVFAILEKGTTGSPPAIMADNYEAAIALLNGFASAANPHKAQKQRVDPRRSGSHQQKQPGRQYVERDAFLEISVLTECRNAEAVARGSKAITILYNMTARIPQLMQQSQLESSEGMS